MSALTVIVQIPFGNKGETVRVALADRGRVLDIRACAPISATSGVMAPTSRGVAVELDQLPRLIEALQGAEARAREMGWIGGDA